MEWTRKQKAYQQTLADPEEERDREQLADFLGVSAETLCRWEEREGFWSEVNRFARAEAERALTSVWQALTGRARRGDVPAIKLLFAMLGQAPEFEAAPQQPIHFKLVVENGNSASLTASPGPPPQPASAPQPNRS